MRKKLLALFLTLTIAGLIVGCGNDESPSSHTQAINTAKYYSQAMPISRSWLDCQLAFEGYSQESIDYALDRLDDTVDWYEQAVRMAKSYMDLINMSQQELIRQLVFEGFTQSQAEHGANVAIE
jgi:thiamine pyrophosphokinase